MRVRNIFTVVAVVLSVVALVRSSRLDRRDLFLRIHEMLLEPEVVKGRRRLYAIKDEYQARSVHEDPVDYTAVHRALALFDLLAKYADNGWIDERTALEEWGHSLVSAREPGRLFIDARSVHVNWRSWPDFERLAERADRFLAGEYHPASRRSWGVRRLRGLPR